MYDTTLSQKYAKDMGLCKKKNKRCIPKEGIPHASACQKKEIKDAYPKKVCHMPRHVKIKEENKRSIPKEGMPHASACQKKMRRDSPYPKERKRDGSY